MAQLIHIKVIPGIKKPEIRRDGTDLSGMPFFVVKVTALPIEGKANDEVVESLSDFFNIPKRYISVRHGMRSREKIISIDAPDFWVNK